MSPAYILGVYASDRDYQEQSLVTCANTTSEQNGAPASPLGGNVL